MFKVLIVEDETIIRDGLRSNIPWQEMGFEVVGSAENGRRAVEFIRENSVDVVMTDVRMPVMDGIELAEYINTKNPDIKVIILSGYADFHYAQAAMKNNVSEYLLKPLKIDEIKNALKRVAEKLDTNKSSKQKNKYEDIIMSVILENDSKALNGISLNNAACCAVFAIDNYRMLNSFEQKQIKKYLQDFKENIFEPKYGGEFSAFIIEDSFVIMVTDRKCADTAYIKRIFNELLAGINESEYESCTLSCGVSSEFSDISELKKRYTEAYQTVKMRFYFGDGIFLEYDDEYRCRSLSNDEYKKCKDKANEIITAINKDTDKIHAQIDEIYTLLSEKTYIKQDIAIKILRGIASAFSDYIMLNAAATEKVAENEMEKFTSLDNMISYLKKCADEIIKIKDGTADEEHSERVIIKQIKKYVKDNYSNRITLKDIEDNFYINKSYFSWLFGKITGQTFTEYLASVRIEESKRLLREENQLKVYEIAELVGYSDYRNFSKIFKKIVGVTPLKYRETL